jgi:hypothetical protein
LLRERLDLLVRVSINDSHSQKPNWILQFKAGFPPWGGRPALISNRQTSGLDGKLLIRT